MTPAISDYLDKRLSSVDKFVDENDNTPMCYVEIGKTTSHHKSGDIFRAEINLHIGGKVFRVEEEKEDLYSAIDAVKDELLAELRKAKMKKMSLIKRGGMIIKNSIKGFNFWKK